MKTWKIWLKDGTSMYKPTFHYIEYGEHFVKLMRLENYKGVDTGFRFLWRTWKEEGEQVQHKQTEHIINKDIFAYAELLEGSHAK